MQGEVQTEALLDSCYRQTEFAGVLTKAKNKAGLVSSHKMSDQVQEYLDLQNNMPVLDEVLAGLRADNGLYSKLRQRDLIQESYGSKTIIRRLIADIKDLAHF